METAWGSCSEISGADRELFRRPVAVTHPSWSGLPMEMVILPGDAEVRDLQHFFPTLAVAVKGRGKRRYASGRSARFLYSAPSMFELYSPDHAIDQANWDGELGEVLSIQFPTAMVNRLLHAEGAGFRFATTHEMYDQRLTDLAVALWAEASSGSPRGRLYAEGISMAMLGLLIEEHGAHHPSNPPRRAGLSVAERKRILEYIDQHLAEALALEDLAATLQMSATHFSRSFKAAFGVTPHAFVVEQRIDAACKRLRAEPSAPLAEIAGAVGFSSQSHFTETFRRRIGTTPGNWRGS
ncbi:MAG: AraC family transcriptional regulator [Roseateles sp.]|nr:MAG: AraC family transcriptional regulator [Roseateles sp.]